MEEDENRVQIQMKKFNKRAYNETFGHYSRIESLSKLKKIIDQDNHILEWTETDIIPKAIKRD